MKRFTLSIFFLLTLIPVISYGAATAVKFGVPGTTSISSSGTAQASGVRRTVSSPVIRAGAARSGTLRMPHGNAGAAADNEIKDGAEPDADRDGAKMAATLKPDAAISANMFSITLTQIQGTFSFQMSVAGNFGINWGDGNATESIVKSNTALETFAHTYVKPGNYVIKLTGKATMYSSNMPAISFSQSSLARAKMTAIDGDLGAIFPILNTSGTGTPRFTGTFAGCSGLTSLPPNLFKGVKGAPANAMFMATFANCNGLAEIPADLFGGITGALAMQAFGNTFYGCTSLTGPSAKSDGQFLYEKWPNATANQVGGCYTGATQLSDYSNIPSTWK